MASKTDMSGSYPPALQDLLLTVTQSDRPFCRAQDSPQSGPFVWRLLWILTLPQRIGRTPDSAGGTAVLDRDLDIGLLLTPAGITTNIQLPESAANTIQQTPFRPGQYCWWFKSFGAGAKWVWILTPPYRKLSQSYSPVSPSRTPPGRHRCTFHTRLTAFPDGDNHSSRPGHLRTSRNLIQHADTKEETRTRGWCNGQLLRHGTMAEGIFLEGFQEDDRLQSSKDWILGDRPVLTEQILTPPPSRHMDYISILSEDLPMPQDIEKLRSRQDIRDFFDGIDE
ncbi:hypothetical protein K440DRAFT_641944 [Wilcoxina mikolae CBS 423.85]|nr:hypothetical protein K440DRAFT_641944 [Wilcoxina mikolae CBS 423.85]